MVSEGEGVMEGEALTEALVLEVPESIGGGVCVREGRPLVEGVGESLGVGVGVIRVDSDTLRLGVRVGKAEGETVVEGAFEVVAVTVEVVEELGQGVRVGKEDRLIDTVGEREGVEELHFEAGREGKADREGEVVGEAGREGGALWQGYAVKEPGTLCVGPSCVCVQVSVRVEVEKSDSVGGFETGTVMTGVPEGEDP